MKLHMCKHGVVCNYNSKIYELPFFCTLRLKMNNRNTLQLDAMSNKYMGIFLPITDFMDMGFHRRNCLTFCYGHEDQE